VGIVLKKILPLLAGGKMSDILFSIFKAAGMAP
jgi:hypothetical protein